MKKLYEDKIENEIDIKLKNTAFERKKFKIEHTNNFSNLENQHDAGLDIKIEPSPLGQFKELLEPSSLGQINKPSPAQTFSKFIKRIMIVQILIFMLFTKAIKQEYLKHGKNYFLIFQIILNHFLKFFMIYPKPYTNVKQI